jgi:hypothetical protein
MARAASEWIKGTFYPPGSVVRPTFANGNSSNAPSNADFESGLTGWTAAAGWAASTVDCFSGTTSASLPTGNSGKTLINNVKAAVAAGQVINGQGRVNFKALGTASIQATITWYKADGVTVSATTTGSSAVVLGIGPDGWMNFTVQGAAPADAAFASLGCIASNTSGHTIYVDYFSWDYALVAFTAPLLFYAVQPASAKSGNTEPVWRDTTTGGNIFDGGVQWSSVQPTSITWICRPLLMSNYFEPHWPTTQGQVVLDGLPQNGINWVAITPQVVDPNDATLPPGSKYVFAAASKMWALDGDIARFSATMNPLDWTAEGNAGFLPIGQRAFGSNPFLAAGIYRSNAVFLNGEGLQMWQLDEDPANMALLDAIPIGCSQHRSIASVNDDMLFLSALGVRSMGISAGSSNLQSGDVGMPVDPLMQPAMAWALANGVEPIGGYFPSLGQYFLAFPNWPADDLFWSSGGTATATNVGNAYTVNMPSLNVLPGYGYPPGKFFFITFTNASTGPSTLKIVGAGDPALYTAQGISDQSKITAGSKWFVSYNPATLNFNIAGGITRLFVYTMGRSGEVGSWSHYLLEYVLEDFCIAGDSVYMRGTSFGAPDVYKFDANWLVDNNAVSDRLTYGIVQWPWLDDGTPGQTKQLSGIDMAVTLTGAAVGPAFTVEIGYDQNDKNAFTAPYTLNGDTMTGMMYPIQVKAPSFAMRLAFYNGQGWSVQAAGLYLTDKRLTS